jgi:hypothetical protein
MKNQNWIKQTLTDRNGKPSTVRQIGWISFLIIIVAALIDMIIALTGGGKTVPDIVYITFGGIVGAAFLGSRFEAPKPVQQQPYGGYYPPAYPKEPYPAGTPYPANSPYQTSEAGD